MQVSTVFPRNVLLSVLGLIVCLPLAIKATWQKARRPAPQSASQIRRTNATGSLKLITGQPGSVVFINGIRHGVTSEKGELDLPHVMAGSYPARVRTTGYADWNGSIIVAPASSRTLKIVQQPTTDEAVLHFQRGEALRDRGKHKDSLEEYRQAITLRSSFPEARIAIARSSIVLQDFQEAEKQVQTAIKIAGRTLVEAQTVLANLRRAQGLVDESIVEYRMALRIARGNSFEAHIGLAIALNEQGKVDEAVKEYRIGIVQDMETEPILCYQLGEILEKAGRNKEAIEAYRSYLRLDPEGEYASAVESIIQRLKE
jgi:Flp pilus assembly protein TadD